MIKKYLIKMYEGEIENEQTQDHTDNIEENYSQANHYQICKKPNCINIKNPKIEIDGRKISEESSNENEKNIYLEEKTESNKSIKQNIPERGIPINVKEINENFVINRLKKSMSIKKIINKIKRKLIINIKVQIINII